LKITEKHNLCFKWSKCNFNVEEIPILGVVVRRSSNGKLQCQSSQRMEKPYQDKKSGEFFRVYKLLLMFYQEFQLYGKTS